MIRDNIIKIAFVTHYTDLFGANKSLINLIESLSSYNHIKAVLIIPGAGMLSDLASRKNIEYKIIPFYYELNHNAHLGAAYRIFNFLRGGVRFLLNQVFVIKYTSYFKQYDIIHSNSSATLMGAYFANNAKKPHIWHIREFGFQDYKMNYNFGYSYFTYWLNKAAGIISISKSIFTQRVNACGVAEKPIIYNGVVSIKEVQANKAASLQTTNNKQFSSMTFGVAGFISYEKNQLEAIKAFHLIADKYESARLLIAGSGDSGYLSELNRYVEKNRLKEKITFLGFKDPIDDVYKMIDCLIMPSKSEAFGRVTVEAMSHGIPVIGFNNAGTSEIIRENYNGFLYVNGAEGLSEKMKVILNDSTIIKRLSTNCFNWVENNYTTEKYSQQVYDLYTRILNDKVSNL